MTETPEDQVFADAIEVANIPTLLMVLVQLTGELHWLEEPYMPTVSYTHLTLPTKRIV